MNYMKDFEIRTRVAENIRSIRKQKKLTQFQLAEKSNLSEATIKSIELAHSYPEKSPFLKLQKLWKLTWQNFFCLLENHSKKIKRIVQN